MSATTEYTPELIERFYSKVSKIPTEQGCLEWMAYHDIKGYGSFGVGNHKHQLAHRLAWFFANGPIPAGLVIRHMCHNPLCCNPAHLEPGSQCDNVRDMMSSGRWMNASNTTTPYVRPPITGRFYAQVSTTPTDSGCLEWTGYRDSRGYGRFSGRWFAHRVAWELVNGPIPEGMIIRHFVCDNPRCCNVEHLRIGTVADNTRDMMDKGRNAQPKGERNFHAKLTARDIIAIRSDLYRGWTLAAIGGQFGIGTSQVFRILNRKCWTHI